jgi:8-oxo-dGTP pyrophosphatase MutT (NUDIX family)
MVKGIAVYENRFLIVEKWYDDRVVNPYQWEFLDGIMKFAEKPDDAVLRLMKEKTGITAEIDGILYTWGFTIGEVCTVGIAYRLLCGSKEVTLAEEYPNYKWVSKEELGEYIENKSVLEDIDRTGLTKEFDIEDFGKVDTFIEHLD